jgi:hypothetical protein
MQFPSRKPRHRSPRSAVFSIGGTVDDLPLLKDPRQGIVVDAPGIDENQQFRCVGQIGVCWTLRARWVGKDPASYGTGTASDLVLAYLSLRSQFDALSPAF